jgi:hypothetical protein
VVRVALAPLHVTPIGALAAVITTTWILFGQGNAALDVAVTAVQEVGPGWQLVMARTLVALVYTMVRSSRLDGH